jgi:hypothetical protein
MAAGRVLRKVDRVRGPLARVEGGKGGEGRWRGVALAWVRDRGEHYLLRPLLLVGITVLTVDSLLFISLFQFLVCFGCDFFFLQSSLACFLTGF